MCGLAGMFCRESVPPWGIFDILFTWTEKRGTDGFGCVVVNKKRINRYLSTDLYTNKRNEVHDFIKRYAKIGDIVLAISRAAPETEPSSSTKNLQPIINSHCVLVHNGSISNSVYHELENWANNKTNNFKFGTQIDSEAIIASYVKHNRNIKDSMEYISGGVACLMYDKDKDCLYVINDFKPIAHCYIRGYGYFLASDNDALGVIVEKLTGCTRDGVCLWEDWYHHYLSGNRIKEIDLDSGFVKNISYSPRYIIGDRWDSNEKKLY